MTVKEMHELSSATVERFINVRTRERITLNYNVDMPGEDFSKAYAHYRKIKNCRVVRVWPVVSNDDGRLGLIIEYQDPA